MTRDFFGTFFGGFFDTFFEYEIIVSSGQYFGQVVCYSQTVVVNRNTVRAV